MDTVRMVPPRLPLARVTLQTCFLAFEAGDKKERNQRDQRNLAEDNEPCRCSEAWRPASLQSKTRLLLRPSLKVILCLIKCSKIIRELETSVASQVSICPANSLLRLPSSSSGMQLLEQE